LHMIRNVIELTPDIILKNNKKEEFVLLKRVTKSRTTSSS